DRETPEAIVGDLWLIETQNLPSNYQKLYLGDVAKTTTDEVKTAAEKIIRDKSLVIVVVGEAEQIKSQLETIAPVTVINEESTK
ncbi:MAG: hypothetical protein ACKOAH_06180, partial [Pirellula sp.]